jgi:hypothetical protein
MVPVGSFSVLSSSWEVSCGYFDSRRTHATSFACVTRDMPCNHPSRGPRSGLDRPGRTAEKRVPVLTLSDFNICRAHVHAPRPSCDARKGVLERSRMTQSHRTSPSPYSISIPTCHPPGAAEPCFRPPSPRSWGWCSKDGTVMSPT